jgi:hypothetical protein
MGLNHLKIPETLGDGETQVGGGLVHVEIAD